MTYKFILINILLFISTLFGYSQDYTQSPDLILEDKLLPSLEASKEEKDLLNFIEKNLISLDISYKIFNFENTDIHHSFSSCIEATIKGGKKDTFILCVPVNYPHGTGKNSSGFINIILALKFLKQAVSQTLPLTLKVVFLSAEFGDEPSYPMGSRLFLEEFYPDYPVMALYLNLRKIPKRLIIRSGAKGAVTPYWLLNKCSTILRQVRIPFLIQGNENQLFRIGFGQESTIIEPYLNASYPSICFEGEYKRIDSNNKEDEQVWISSFMKFFWNLTETYKNGIPEEWDQHYLFFQISNFFFMLSEQTYLIIFLIASGIMILFALLFIKKVIKFLKIIIKKWWVIPVIYFLCFLFFLSATVIIDGTLWIRNNHLLWASWPLLFLILKFLLTSLFFLLCYTLLRKLPIPNKNMFYSYSALILIFINIIILALINISFIYYFLWAFFCIFLFIIIQNKPIKIILLLISPFWLINATINLFTIPKLEFCKIILLSPIKGNLLLAVFVIPYILLFVKMRLLFPYTPMIRRIFHIVSLACLSIGSAGLIIFLLFASPFSPDNPQKVKIINRIDLDSQLNLTEISSAAPLGEISFYDGENYSNFKSPFKKLNFSATDIPELLSIETDTIRILDRKIITLSLYPLGMPYRISLCLGSASNDEFTLFDSNFPFEKDTSGKKYNILVGKHPPNPFFLELILPENLEVTLFIRIEYLSPPFKLEFSGKNKEFDTRLVIQKKIQIKT